MVAKAKSDLYQETTDAIIAALEAGPGKWEQSWRQVTGHRALNHVTGKPYSGVNALTLMIECMNRGVSVNRWATFKQAQAKGGQVKKGSKGVSLCFYRRAENASADESEEKSRVFLSRFHVFHVSDIDGFEPKDEDQVPVPESLAKDILEKSGAEIRVGEPCYLPTIDAIRLPKVSDFQNLDDYYGTAFHELVHWTGAEKRLDRNLKGRFGDEAYAVEELIAELGSAMLCNVSGVQFISQSSKYIDHWLKVLKQDKRAVFTAASKSQQAADFLLGKAGYNQEIASDQ